MSPVERAARALCEAERMDPDANLGPQDDPHPQWWFYIERVEAVLKAVREPSDAMVKAALDAKSIGDDGVSDAYRSMIDALLN